MSHAAEHAVSSLASPFMPARNLICHRSRRWFLQTGLSGVAGLSLPALLAAQARMTLSPALSPRERERVRSRSFCSGSPGGPSHIDMWDPKPDAPQEIRSPFGTIQTRLPGVQFTEHLPLQASIADKLSIIRSVDCTCQQPHADYHASRQSARSPNRRRPRRWRLSVDGVASRRSIAARMSPICRPSSAWPKLGRRCLRLRAFGQRSTSR